MKRKKNRKNNKNINNRQMAVTKPTALAAFCSLVRAQLLPVSAAGGATGAIIAQNDNTAAIAIAAVVAALLHIFISAFNDYCDRAKDVNLPNPNRFNPVALKILSDKFALICATLAALSALVMAAAFSFINLWIVLTIIGFGGIYSLRAKKFPPLGLPCISIAMGLCSAICLTGQAAASWLSLPILSVYIVLFVAAFVWAWQKRIPPLWGNNWLHLLVISAAALPLSSFIVDHSAAMYAPEGISISKPLMMAALLIVIMLAIFFKSAPANRPAALQYIGLLWLVPVWMTFISVAADGNIMFVPAIALPLSLLGAKLLSGRKRTFVKQ